MYLQHNGQVALTLLLAIVLLHGATAQAQTTGSLEGSVLDPAGAALPAARLELTEQETSAVRRTQTDAAGVYTALRLPPGVYKIRVSHPDFREQVRAGITISAGRGHRVNFTLELGSRQEEIVVTADVPLVDPSVADYGGQISSKQLHELPLNGRDLYQLAALEPGVTLPTSADRSGITNGLGSALSVNGARANQNAFRLDGVYINDSVNAVPSGVAGLTLGIESIREVHIATNPYSAEYGRAAGAVFTAVSRSGTNEPHGSVYWYFRNSALDAKNFFDRGDQAVPPLRRNQFGAAFGGPIRRDKAFFLVNYEGFRGRLGSTRRPIVPSAQARQGILPSDDGGERRVTVAPEMRPYLDLFPTPNGRDFGDGTAEFVSQGTLKDRQDHFSSKVDLLLSEQLRLSLRYTFDDGDNAFPEPLQVWTFTRESRNYFFHSDLQYVHSPNTIFNVRGAFSQVFDAELSEVRNDIPASLSFVEGLPLGVIQVTGLSPLGGVPARLRPRRFDLKDYQFNADVTHTAGRHTVRAGAGFDRILYDQVADLSAVGFYRFTSLEDFLAADSGTGEVMRPGSDSQRYWSLNQFHGYVQDDIRMTKRLSLSVGVRYETASTPRERNDKVASLRNPYFDPQVVTGDPLYENPSTKNFAPRASVAWDVNGSGSTVIRAGGGIFYDLLGVRELAVAGLRMPPFFQRVNIFDPVFPDILSAAEQGRPNNSMDGLQYDPEQPSVARWRFGIDRRLTDSQALKIEYVGARGAHLMARIEDMNVRVPEVLPDGTLFFAADAPRLNPNFGQIGMRRAQFNSFYQGLNVQLLGRFSQRLQYQSRYTWSKSIDESSSAIFTDFDSADGMPTPLNIRQNRGLSDFDARQTFTSNFSYQTPDLDGPAAVLLGGWGLHGVVTLQSGHPFAPWVGFDRTQLGLVFGDAGQRPDLVAETGSDIILGDPAQWFDPTAFALQPAGFYGNLGRGTLTADGVFNVDFALHKDVWRTERHRTQLRVEIFNLTNHPNFRFPSSLRLFNRQGGRVGSAGRVTRTSTGPREVQLSLRWIF